jgi:hypothetical protein
MISTWILGAIRLATFVAGGGEAIIHEELGVSPLNPVIDQPGVADFTKWLAVSTIVLAVATIALAVFSLLQAVIMRRTARRQLRAYVFITTAEIGDIDDSQNLHASVSIKNSGQTPAYDLINRGAITIREARLRGDLWPEDKEASLSKTALGPGEVLGKYFSARPLTTEERAAVRSGTHAIYVYGEILYKDAFRRRRHSRYRFMHGGEAAIRSRQLVICDEGNEAN